MDIEPYWWWVLVVMMAVGAPIFFAHFLELRYKWLATIFAFAPVGILIAIIVDRWWYTTLAVLWLVPVLMLVRPIPSQPRDSNQELAQLMRRLERRLARLEQSEIRAEDLGAQDQQREQEHQQIIEANQVELEQRDEKILELEQTLSEIEHELERKQTESTGDQRTLANKEKELEGLNSEISKLRQERSDIQTRLAQENKSNQQREQKIRRQQVEAEQDRQQLLKEIEELQRRLKRMEVEKKRREAEEKKREEERKRKEEERRKYRQEEVEKDQADDREARQRWGREAEKQARIGLWRAKPSCAWFGITDDEIKADIKIYGDIDIVAGSKQWGPVVVEVKAGREEVQQNPDNPDGIITNALGRNPNTNYQKVLFQVADQAAKLEQILGFPVQPIVCVSDMSNSGYIIDYEYKHRRKFKILLSSALQLPNYIRLVPIPEDQNYDDKMVNLFGPSHPTG